MCVTHRKYADAQSQSRYHCSDKQGSARAVAALRSSGAGLRTKYFGDSPLWNCVVTFVRLTCERPLDTLVASVEFSTAPPALNLNVSFPLMLLALVCPDEGRFFLVKT